MLVRAASAIVGLSALWATWFYLQQWGLGLVIGVIGAIAIKEYNSLFFKSDTITKIAFNLMSLTIMSTVCLKQIPSIAIFATCVLSIMYFILFKQSSIEARLKDMAFFVLGLFYCGGLVGTVLLGLIQFDISFFISLLILSFTTDTFAYLGGRLLGKHSLSPLISPNKTWEGSIVGLMGGASCGFLYLNSLPHSCSWPTLVLCCALFSAASQVGDLFESLLKRHCNVKDSGRILPGHGGALDRIDGLLFVAPLLYLWMNHFLLP